MFLTLRDSDMVRFTNVIDMKELEKKKHYWYDDDDDDDGEV